MSYPSVKGDFLPDSIGTLFFKEKQVRLLLTLNNNSEKEWHITDLAKEANVTYVHTSKFINKCESAGIVASERHGRVKRLYLTEKGISVAKEITGTMNKVGSKEAPAPSVAKA